VAKVDNNFIYAHPIISDMAQAIVSFMAPGTETKDVVPTVTIQNMIERYSHDMPDVKTSVAPRPAHETVLLTGSTGSLGSELLAMLLGNDRVQKVYALNRPSTQRSSLARHEDTFQQR
jgi:FlaA1/EpsC-like NDP-sugar epimerase